MTNEKTTKIAEGIISDNELAKASGGTVTAVQPIMPGAVQPLPGDGGLTPVQPIQPGPVQPLPM